jgi:ABC-type multidrug transport system permease subunit
MILLEIIKKNFRMLVRSKASAVIILLGPLLLMLLISLAFNSSSLYDIKVGTYSSSYSELSNSIIDKLKDDAFTIEKVETEESCIDAVKDGRIHICAVFPPDMDITTEGSIVFHVDKSRMNLVWSIMGSISSKVSTKSTELSTLLTTKLLNALQRTDTLISENGGSISGLKDKLISMKNSVAEVQSELEVMEVANQSLLDIEMNEIKEEINASNSVFSDLEDVIDKISADISEIMATKEKTVVSLQGIRSNVDEQINDAEKMKEMVDSIKSEIEAIEIKDVQKIVSPVTTEIKPLTTEGTHLMYSFPTLLLMVILFAGIFLASTIVIEEKKSKAYFRNFISPTTDSTYILSDYLFSIIILGLQALVIFVVMNLITKAKMPSALWPNLIVGFLLIATIFIFLGMVIGYVFRSDETANIASVSIATILLFFSNTILPIESLPTAIRSIVNLNPLVIGESIVRKMMLFNDTLKGVQMQVYFLLGYVVVLVILAFLARKLAKRRIGQE